MKVEYINPFVRALGKTFRTMLDCELQRGGVFAAIEESPLHDISGVIGLSGRAIGTVVVSFSREVALNAASTLLLHETREIDADVVDAVGEIANMVAGAAKAELEEFNMSISLPTVIVGANHEVRFPSNVVPICVPFQSPWGELTLCVGLSEILQPVA
jgi:chemotaxis protein CheX